MGRYLAVVLFIVSSFVIAEESTCFGTTANGRLSGGARLPGEGNNFVSYSTTAEIAGRTYVHSSVREIIVEAYKRLESKAPGKVYKYAETGFRQGGQFKPHKTHQNGLSVDFMVPVVNREGESVHLPTHYFNKLGYAIEFDEAGQYKDYRIDYEAMAAHIVALHKVSKSKGFGLWRVIFDPQLRSHLMQTRYGEYLQTHVEFSRKRSWVRHDEHYHVDFEIPCKKI